MTQGNLVAADGQCDGALAVRAAVSKQIECRSLQRDIDRTEDATHRGQAQSDSKPLTAAITHTGKA